METEDGISIENTIRLGLEWYRANRIDLERDSFGQFVVVNVITKDVILSNSSTAAHLEFERRFPGQPGWGTRVGEIS